MAPPLSALPYDLQEGVFDHLKARRHFRSPARDLDEARRHTHELQRYCQVSREWHEYFQSYLWAEVSFGEISLEKSKRCIYSFLDTIVARPSLAKAVTALRLAQPFHRFPGYQSLTQREDDQALQVLCASLGLFPRLEAVTLVGGTIDHWAGSEPFAVPQSLRTLVLFGPFSHRSGEALEHFRHITSLHLDNGSQHVPRPMFNQVKAQFPNLTALFIENVLPSLASTFFDGGFGFRLQHLGIHFPGGPPGTHALPAPAQLPDLRFLTLDADDFFPPDILAKYSQLQTLHLRTDHPGSGLNSNPEKVVLKTLTALERLALWAANREHVNLFSPRTIQIDCDAAELQSLDATARFLALRLHGRLARNGWTAIGPDGGEVKFSIP